MNKMDTARLQQAKSELLRKQPIFLLQAKKKVKGNVSYICPKCGNGKGKDGTGISLDTQSKAEFPHWHCSKCGLHADIIEL